MFKNYKGLWLHVVGAHSVRPPNCRNFKFILFILILNVIDI